MSSLSTYFHPDDVMLALAGVLSDGLKYHAAAMEAISTSDQIDDIEYEVAMEKAVAQDPKMIVAKLFAENRNSIFMSAEAVAAAGSQRPFYKQQLTLNVSFSRMRRRFVREIARITRVPALKPPSNVNVRDEEMPMHTGNVTSMVEWREKRKSAA